MNKHPYPNKQRKNFTLLDGIWELSISKEENIDTSFKKSVPSIYNPPQDYEYEIIVPYSPEAPKSGVNRTLMPNEKMWYRKTFEYESSKGMDVFLCFISVDWRAEVFVNGEFAVKHEGGYTPFEANITESLRNGSNTIEVLVHDFSNTRPYSHGKQSLKPHGMWYRAQSGIWQSVFLEERPQKHITTFYAVTNADLKSASIYVGTNEKEKGTCTLTLNKKEIPLQVNNFTCIDISRLEPWSPENPRIYPVTLNYRNDSIESYLTFRHVGVVNGKFVLNGKDIFSNGVLDQGYSADGLLTFTEAEMRNDIKMLKALGFNTIRKHIKIESPLYYRICDEEGMLVWQDFVSGGEPSKIVAMAPALLTFINFRDDRHHSLFGRKMEAGKQEFIEHMKETVEHLRFFNCIILWTIFNEGWGQFDAVKQTEVLRNLDNTRLIDSTSGWHDQGCGDVHSLHRYFQKYKHKRDKNNRAVVLSEYGGLIYRIPGHTYNDKDFIYSKVSSKEEWLSKLRKLFQELKEEKEKGLTAAIYTQTSDIEEESNGFITFDREVLKADISELRKIIDILN